MKVKAAVNAFLMLMKGDSILCSLRENTGWEDGSWGLVVGGVEEGECASEAVIREAKEEAGIDIRKEDVEFVHVMHHNTVKAGKEDVDLFFMCKKFEGSIENKEPHKCGGLAFFSVTDLPQNMAPYLSRAILKAIKGVSYSEYGFKKEKSSV